MRHTDMKTHHKVIILDKASKNFVSLETVRDILGIPGYWYLYRMLIFVSF